LNFDRFIEEKMVPYMNVTSERKNGKRNPQIHGNPTRKYQ
jgi:hypothetical protein